MNKTLRPEIMSPAGYWPQLDAAIEAGADAVYFGLTHFTARAKVGFTLEELPNVMQTLHRRGVRGYVTFNTLIFGHELAEASRAIAAIAAAGVDAIIVQDIGMAKLAKQIAPTLEVHGSTQMSITNAAGVEFARRLGINRVYWHVNYHSKKSAPSEPKPMSNSKCSCMGRCACRTRGNVFRLRPGVDGVPIVANAPKPVVCPTN